MAPVLHVDVDWERCQRRVTLALGTAPAHLAGREEPVMSAPQDTAVRALTLKIIRVQREIM